MEISVIIPTYKPKDYLWRCLDSLVNQSLDKQLFEIIIVLNGETGGYKDAIEQYISSVKDCQIRLMTTETAGVSNARNIGIDNALGRYLVFIDDDDWISGQYLENLLQRADSGCIVVSNILHIDDQTNEQLPHYMSKAFEKAMQKKPHSQFQYRSFLSSSCEKLIPKDVIGSERFNTKYELGEDALFMFAISKRISGIRFSDVHDIYYVRARHESVSRVSKTIRTRCRNLLKLVCSYFSIWIKDITRYNILLFLSRIAACLRKIFIQEKRQKF